MTAPPRRTGGEEQVVQSVKTQAVRTHDVKRMTMKALVLAMAPLLVLTRTRRTTTKMKKMLALLVLGMLPLLPLLTLWTLRSLGTIAKWLALPLGMLLVLLAQLVQMSLLVLVAASRPKCHLEGQEQKARPVPSAS